MQAKPHQRITKYPLVLKAVLKTTQDPYVQHALRGMVRHFETWSSDLIKSAQEFLNILLLTLTAFPLGPGQLSSMNSFLDSINDYLKLKDEELALSISAQRVEQYEVERINEEIDKVKIAL